MEIGPEDNYLFLYYNKTPSIVNLFISQQDRLNILNNIKDSKFYEKLIRKYSTQIEQGIKTKENDIRDIYIYSSNNTINENMNELQTITPNFKLNWLNTNNGNNLDNILVHRRR